MSRLFIAACRNLHGDLNATHLALAQEVQRYRSDRVILCSRLLLERLIRFDVPRPKLSVTLADRWRDISEGNDGNPPDPEDAEAIAQFDLAGHLWLAVGYKGVGVVLRLDTPAKRLEAANRLLRHFRSRRPAPFPLSRNQVQSVLEPASLFVNLRRTRDTGFLYRVGAELHGAILRRGVRSEILDDVSSDVASFVLTRCRPI